MGFRRNLAARSLSSASETPKDFLHYGAPAIARRVFGSDDPEYVRTVYYWTSEIRADRRPEFLIKVAGRWCAWESRIREHTEQSAALASPAAPQIPNGDKGSPDPAAAGSDTGQDGDGDPDNPPRSPGTDNSESAIRRPMPADRLGCHPRPPSRPSPAIQEKPDDLTAKLHQTQRQRPRRAAGNRC
jgi:hypothetical protein